MVDGDGDDVVGWYDINYIYRRMTPRFVDYDEVEAGKIKQSFTFLLKDITWYKLHILLDQKKTLTLWWEICDKYHIWTYLGGEDFSHGTDVSVQLAGENSGAIEAILFTNNPLGSILVRKEQKAESDQKFCKN